MKFKKSDLKLVSEAQAEGLLASMTQFINYKGRDLTNELSQYFKEQIPDYNGQFYDYDYECDDILYQINNYIEENNIDKYLLDFPLTNGSDIHLIPINENLQLQIIITDDYYGDGDYLKYIKSDAFIVNHNTTKEDVDQLIDFIKKNFLFM